MIIHHFFLCICISSSHYVTIPKSPAIWPSSTFIFVAPPNGALTKMILDVVLSKHLNTNLVVVINVNDVRFKHAGFPFVVVNLYDGTGDIIILLPHWFAVLVKGILSAVKKPSSLFFYV